MKTVAYSVPKGKLIVQKSWRAQGRFWGNQHLMPTVQQRAWQTLSSRESLSPLPSLMYYPASLDEQSNSIPWTHSNCVVTLYLCFLQAFGIKSHFFDVVERYVKINCLFLRSKLDIRNRAGGGSVEGGGEAQKRYTRWFSQMTVGLPLHLGNRLWPHLPW